MQHLQSCKELVQGRRREPQVVPERHRGLQVVQGRRRGPQVVQVLGGAVRLVLG